jgi:hypothetical protein
MRLTNWYHRELGLVQLDDFVLSKNRLGIQRQELLPF